MVSSKNFSVRQISSFWRVIGPGNKILPGKYRRERQALQALKEEVDKFFKERNFGFVKETALQIEAELKRVELLELEEENARSLQRHGENDQNDAKDGEISNGYEGRQENDEGIALQIAKERQENFQKGKKVMAGKKKGKGKGGKGC